MITTNPTNNWEKEREDGEIKNPRIVWTKYVWKEWQSFQAVGKAFPIPEHS